MYATAEEATQMAKEFEASQKLVTELQEQLSDFQERHDTLTADHEALKEQHSSLKWGFYSPSHPGSSCLHSQPDSY